MEQEAENTPNLPQTVGAILREARERLGLSVADAAAQTKLAPRQIEALEADNYEGLPEVAFVRGFVRSYAKILQLDSTPLLAQLPQIKQGYMQVEMEPVEAPFPDARSSREQNIVWLGAALFLSVIVVAFAVYNLTTPVVPKVEEVAQTTQAVEHELPIPAGVTVVAASDVAAVQVGTDAQASAESQMPAPVDANIAPVTATPSIAATKTPQPAPEKMAAVQALPVAKPVVAPQPVEGVPATLRMTFSGASWVEVRDRNGAVLVSQNNSAGSELRLSGKGPLSVVVGNAASAKLFYKGKQVNLLSQGGNDVARLTLE